METHRFRRQFIMEVELITGNWVTCRPCKVYRPTMWLTSRPMFDNSNGWLGFSS